MPQGPHSKPSCKKVFIVSQKSQNKWKSTHKKTITAMWVWPCREGRFVARNCSCKEPGPSLAFAEHKSCYGPHTSYLSTIRWISNDVTRNTYTKCRLMCKCCSTLNWGPTNLLVLAYPTHCPTPLTPPPFLWTDIETTVTRQLLQKQYDDCAIEKQGAWSVLSRVWHVLSTLGRNNSIDECGATSYSPTYEASNWPQERGTWIYS